LPEKLGKFGSDFLQAILPELILCILRLGMALALVPIESVGTMDRIHLFVQDGDLCASFGVGQNRPLLP
jgi:hypothetical protein